MDSDIIIKSAQQVAGIRRACKLAAEILDGLDSVIKPGITTGAIDDWCSDAISAAGAQSAALNYCPPGHKPFPKSVCTSVNHTVCHGIPSHAKQLHQGDIVNIDVTVICDGFFGDSSRMYLVGKASKQAQALCTGTYRCLQAGIDAVGPDVALNEIGNAIQDVADELGYGIVQEFCGHGTGVAFHEAPQVLHYRSTRASSIVLKPNMILTIEPMINAGRPQVRMLTDGWTVVTRDRSLSAQWEHTVLVTEQGCEILTVNGKE